MPVKVCYNFLFFRISTTVSVSAEPTENPLFLKFFLFVCFGFHFPQWSFEHFVTLLKSNTLLFLVCQVEVNEKTAGQSLEAVIRSPLDVIVGIMSGGLHHVTVAPAALRRFEL